MTLVSASLFCGFFVEKLNINLLNPKNRMIAFSSSETTRDKYQKTPEGLHVRWSSDSRFDRES